MINIVYLPANEAILREFEIGLINTWLVLGQKAKGRTTKTKKKQRLQI